MRNKTETDGELNGPVEVQSSGTKWVAREVGLIASKDGVLTTSTYAEFYPCRID
jgi:hypothetical protein